jgi:hypothetical protein
MKKLVFLLLLNSTAYAQFKYEPRVQLIGGLSAAFQSGKFMQKAEVGTITNSFIATAGLQQFRDTMLLAPSNTLFIETGVYFRIGKFLPTVQIGYSAIGWYFKPSLKFELSNNLMLDVYAYQKFIGIGFLANFSNKEY